MANIDGNNSANTLNGTNNDDIINGYGGNDTINGVGGNDLIHGGSGNDSITGSSGGNNTIQGSSGNDSIFGGSFNDLLDGGTGNDTLDGWDGNDTIDGGDGFDLIYGGTSDDMLIGRGGDTVYGGEDWDTLVSAGGENYLYGENGRDQLSAQNGGDSSVAHFYGGLGEDIAWSSRALDGSYEGQAIEVYMGTGNDTVFAGEWNVTAFGEEGDDVLNAGGGGGTKYLSGGEGNDTLVARDSFGDGLGTLTGRFYGDAGMDTLKITYAAGSTNRLDGGADQDTFITDTSLSSGDTIIGGSGYDIFDGSALTQGITQAIGGTRIANTASITGIEYYMSGSGDDWFDLTQNNTTLYTNAGNDLIYINAANSYVDAGSGDDSVVVTSMKNTTFNSFIGGDGTDWVYVGGSTAAVIDLTGVLQIGSASGGLHYFEAVSATSGNDTITGNSSGNWLFGNAGRDRINGAEGNDEIFGGTGRDTLTGGAGSDVFYFTTGDTGTGRSADQITDFVRNKDDIDVSGLGATTYRGTGAFTGTAGELRYAQSGAHTIIQIDANGDGTADSHIRLNYYSSGLSASDFIF